MGGSFFCGNKRVFFCDTLYKRKARKPIHYETVLHVSITERYSDSVVQCIRQKTEWRQQLQPMRRLAASGIGTDVDANIRKQNHKNRFLSDTNDHFCGEYLCFRVRGKQYGGFTKTNLA